MGSASTRRFASARGYVSAFALTWLIETIVYLAAFTSLGLFTNRRLTVAAPALLLLVLVVNLVSHPVLWLVASGRPRPGRSSSAELGVVLVEGTLIALVLRGRWVWAYAAALLANACSFLIGLVAAATLSGAGSVACC